MADADIMFSNFSFFIFLDSQEPLDLKFIIFVNHENVTIILLFGSTTASKALDLRQNYGPRPTG